MQTQEFRRLAQTLKSNLSRLMEQRSTGKPLARMRRLYAT